MGDGDELHALVQELAQRSDRELTVLVVGHRLDDRSRSARHLQEGDDVALVLGPRAQDPVAGAEAQRVEGHVPGAGGVLDDGDLVGVGAQQPGELVVDGLQALGGLRGGLVAPDARLALEVPDDDVEDGLGRQGGARVVEVRDVRAPGRLRPRPGDVEAVHRVNRTR